MFSARPLLLLIDIITVQLYYTVWTLAIVELAQLK